MIIDLAVWVIGSTLLAPLYLNRRPDSVFDGVVTELALAPGLLIWSVIIGSDE